MWYYPRHMGSNQEKSMFVLVTPRSDGGIGEKVKVRKLEFEDKKPKAVREKGVFPRGWRLRAQFGFNVTESSADSPERYEATVPRLPEGLATGFGEKPSEAVKDLGQQLVQSYNELVPGMSRETLSPELLNAAVILNKKLQPPRESALSRLRRRKAAK